jgi:hypothetical protein
MDYDAVLAQVLELLQREQRVAVPMSCTHGSRSAWSSWIWKYRLRRCRQWR